MSSFIRQHKGAVVWSLVLHVAVLAAVLMTVIPWLAAAASRSRDGARSDRHDRRYGGARARSRKQRDEAARQERQRQQREERQRREADEQQRQTQQREEQRVANEQRARDEAAQKERERVAADKARQTRSEEQAASARAAGARDAREEAQRRRSARKRPSASASGPHSGSAKRTCCAPPRSRPKRMPRAMRACYDQYISHDRDSASSSNWHRPLSARLGIDCIVNVVQLPTGDVVSATVASCNGDDAVRRSIERAVRDASPLPKPPTPALFQRNLNVSFQPDE